MIVILNIVFVDGM